ncbi:MAG TPA: PhoPQ-activated protein PqaA family protein, partial [Bryobacteraceae bacterium]|nr:PhoPQ-activated protein PqaA family protein [Bryobacteraceae bacterium]
MNKLLLSLALLLSCVPAFGQGEQETGLDRYVKMPDPAYKWSLVKSIPGDGVTAYVLDMTSQTWLTANEVDRPEWKHWVIVYKPDTLKHSTALLMIGGSSNDSPGPAKQDQFFTQISKKTSSITVELRMVPNQPLSFYGEARKRTEDAIIAYNWMKHMETGEDKWATRLPMTKAAVRAMDATTEFLKSEAGGSVKVDKFVITGGSKRGWTTWTTGIVDKRVVAIMPVVIDLLNVVPSFEHHWRAYGFWAPAVGDYVEHGVMDKFSTPEFARLMKLVEPYEYRGRLTMPKYIVNSAGDQFFLPDSWQFYWNDLKGEKYLRYVPNSDHSVTRRTDAA